MSEIETTHADEEMQDYTPHSEFDPEREAGNAEVDDVHAQSMVTPVEDKKKKMAKVLVAGGAAVFIVLGGFAAWTFMKPKPAQFRSPSQMAVSAAGSGWQAQMQSPSAAMGFHSQGQALPSAATPGQNQMPAAPQGQGVAAPSAAQSSVGQQGAVGQPSPSVSQTAPVGSSALPAEAATHEQNASPSASITKMQGQIDQLITDFQQMQSEIAALQHDSVVPHVATSDKNAGAHLKKKRKPAARRNLDESTLHDRRSVAIPANEVEASQVAPTAPVQAAQSADLLKDIHLIGIAPGNEMAWITVEGKTGIYKVGNTLIQGVVVRGIGDQSVSTSAGVIKE